MQILVLLEQFEQLVSYFLLCRWTTWINIKHTDESLADGVMYRPPSTNAEYFSNMLDQLDHVHSEYDNVILLGDLNHNDVFW